MPGSGPKWVKVGRGCGRGDRPGSASSPEWLAIPSAGSCSRGSRCSPVSSGTRSTARDGSPFRPAFGAELAPGAHVARWMDNCLAIFPNQAWQRLADRVGEQRYADAGARTFSRFLFSGAFDVELDSQGRVVLPAALREFAGLKTEAVVVGALDHIELWEPERWASASAEMSSDVFAERIARPRDLAQPNEPPGSVGTVGNGSGNGGRAPARDGGRGDRISLHPLRTASR